MKRGSVLARKAPQGALWILSCLAALFPNILHSQSPWEWRNPVQQGNSLRSVTFVNQTTGWAVDAAGTLMETRNAGATWLMHDAVTSRFLFGIGFNDQLHGIAVGDSGEIICTDDGGGTWSRVDGGVTWFTPPEVTGNTLSGLYLVRLQAGDMSATHKALLIR